MPRLFRETEICWLCAGADPGPGQSRCPICGGHGEVPVPLATDGRDASREVRDAD